jgi:hypothetical protein
MKLSDCVALLDAEVLVPAKDMGLEIRVACGSDLMSDAMAFACASNEMMLTGLVNLQVIRTAEMMDVHVLVFVRGKRPDAAMVDLAREKGICVLRTVHPMFTACGLLHGAGIVGKGA